MIDFLTSLLLCVYRSACPGVAEIVAVNGKLCSAFKGISVRLYHAFVTSKLDISNALLYRLPLKQRSTASERAERGSTLDSAALRNLAKRYRC